MVCCINELALVVICSVRHSHLIASYIILCVALIASVALCVVLVIGTICCTLCAILLVMLLELNEHWC